MRVFPRPENLVNPTVGPNRDLCIWHEPVKMYVSIQVYECKNVKTEMIQAWLF